MLMESIIAECREHKATFQEGKFFLIQENHYQHADFILVAWLTHLLQSNQKVTFIAFRQNYAHFLALSKKLGKSIEPFLKNQQLKYIECFQHQFCSELPLTESSPSCYCSPPSAVKKILTKDLMKSGDLFDSNEAVIVDCISYLDEHPEICFWIYEQAVLKQSRPLIFGGCLQDSELANILTTQADLTIQMENDVAGHGKLKVVGPNWMTGLLWRVLQGKVQVSQHLKI